MPHDTDRDLRCAACGGALVAVLQTVPYIAPGPRVVELRDVASWQCMRCGDLRLAIPDRSSLDLVARAIVAVSAESVAQLAFTDNRWRIVRR